MKTELVSFYGTQISCVQTENQIMVAIKPVCEDLGLHFKSQSEAIKNDEVLKDVVGEHRLHDSLGREQNSLFLPLEFIHGWLFQIKFTNTMSDETKEALIKYKRECYKILYNHFFKNLKKQLEMNALEIELLKEINDLNDRKGDILETIKDKKKRLEKIREERLNNEPTLF